jgi:hypothetical protein
MLDDLELLEALLMAQEAFEDEDVSDEAIVRFAMGWLSEDEEQEMLSRLVRSDRLRNRLIEIRSLMECKENQTTVKFGNGAFDQVLRRILGEAIASFQAPRLVVGGAASRTAVSALGRSLRSRPLLPAAVRSGHQTRFHVEPDGPGGILALEPGNAGTTHVVLRASPGTTLGTDPLSIVYDDSDFSIVIGEILPQGSKGQVELQALGSNALRLRPDMFRVVREVQGSHWPNTIRAEVLASPAQPFRVRLARLPHVEDGKLIVEPIIPEAVAMNPVNNLVDLKVQVGIVDVLLATQETRAGESRIRIESEWVGASPGDLACTDIFSLCFRPRS